MTIVILFLLYLVLPFAELAAIIVLAVLNGQKKRKIDELNRELAAARAGAAWRPENAWENAPERVPEMRRSVCRTVFGSARRRAHLYRAKRKTVLRFHRGLGMG